MFDPYADVAAELRAHPGRNYLVAGGPLARRPVLQSTAYRINRGVLADFQPDPAGYFVAKVRKSREPDAEHEVEMDMEYRLTIPVNTG